MYRESLIYLKETPLRLHGFSHLINWCGQVKMRSERVVKISLDMHLLLALAHRIMVALHISQGEVPNLNSASPIANPN